jgi:hypothetical protein
MAPLETPRRRRRLGHGRAASGRRVDRGEQGERRRCGRPRGERLRAFQHRLRHVGRLSLSQEGADRAVVAIKRKGERRRSRGVAVAMAAAVMGHRRAGLRGSRRGAVVRMAREVVQAVAQDSGTAVRRQRHEGKQATESGVWRATEHRQRRAELANPTADRRLAFARCQGFLNRPNAKGVAWIPPHSHPIAFCTALATL